MGLNRWLGAIMITSLVGFLGCAQPTPKTGSTKAPVAANTPVPTETADAPEPAESPAATASPAATPATGGTPVAAAGGVKADFENADGMEGYEDVMAMEVVASSADSVAKGKELFAANCATCHGDSGAGDGPAGAALDPPPANLTAPAGYKYGSMELGIYRTVYYGVDGTGMAPWGDALDDGPKDTWALVHYVRSIQK